MSDTWYSEDDELLPQSDRLQILSPEEYELLWGMPRFSAADREVFFDLTPHEEASSARLYLLCFVHDRYQRLNDHLLGAFCALVRRYSDEVTEATKEAVYQHKRRGLTTWARA